MKKEGIEISVTVNGVTKTTHMSMEKWNDERDAMDGIAPCDEFVYGVIEKDLVTQYMMGLIDKTP